ncbi:hypothetical protein ACPOM7_17530 [Peribacillus castrilensis]|uniref:hypothetical protein n=1 Tax=Bacillaceae TaxID=186817 RepID=UPI000661559D|nr:MULTISPECIES: hypothetical protein [Bacillaceae]MCT1390138.1 hypothetical protein [Peribacillus frigoritolerans]PRA81583.1 hypothetical protein CQ056_20500 [Peribacillus simplex]
MRKNEIERLFNEEIRDKKKTGSGSFKRTGKGVKNGIRGGMRFPYQNLSRKEQKEYTKPGEVKVFNLNDVLPIKSLVNKPEKEQRELLERWRNLYTNEVIYKKMGTSQNRYYKLLKKLNVEKKPAFSGKSKEKKKVELSLLGQFKEDIPDYQTFLGIERAQQIELMAHYDKKYTVEQLAEKMGTLAKTLYQLRYRINKFNEKQPTKENEEIKSDSIFDVFENPVTNSEVAAGEDHHDHSTENVAVLKPNVKTSSIKNDSQQEQLSLELEGKNNLELKQTTTYTINGLYSGTEVSEKLKKVSDLLLGEANQFDIQLTIHEIPNSSRNPEIDKEKILKALLKMLS